jgi:hypothetical protein
MTSSICIPRMDASITKEYITTKINSLNIGHIRQLREIPLKNDPSHKRVLMRFHWKENNDKSINLQKQLMDLGSLKIVHNMPWYWKLVITQ